MSDEFVNRAVRCPVCQTAFTHDQPVAGAASGRDSDFRPVYAGRDPLPAQMLTCPTCRYSAYAEGFDAEGELGDDERLLLADSSGPRASSVLPDDDDVDQLRRFVKRREYLEGLAPGAEPFGAARYLLAARCHEFLEDDDHDGIIDLYLRASWCARLTHEVELEKRCQREVVARLRKRLDEKDEKKKLPDAERARALYLVAELSGAGRAISPRR